VQLENRQVVNGAFQHFLQSPAPSGGFVGTTFATEDGFEPGYIQEPTGAINEPLVELVHFTTPLKEQIAAVLQLIGAIGITKLGALLFWLTQAKA
jgi:hypothetical protein